MKIIKTKMREKRPSPEFKFIHGTPKFKLYP